MICGHFIVIQPLTANKFGARRDICAYFFTDCYYTCVCVIFFFGKNARLTIVNLCRLVNNEGLK